MKNRFTTFSRFLAASTTVFVAIHSAQAADQTWKTTGFTDGNWTTSGNWVGGFAPGAATGVTSGDTATFNGGANLSVTPDATRNIKNITFDTSDAGAFTISGGSLVLTNAGAITVNASVTNTQTINSDLLLSTTASSTYSFFNNSSTSGAKLNIGGNITGQASATNEVLTLGGTNGGTVSGIIGNGVGGGTVGITKTGTGSWTLSGANTYTGGTNINGGTLVIGTTNTLLTTGNLTMNSTGSGSTPATLDLTNFSQTVNNLTVSNRASSAVNTDIITIGSGKTLTVNGNATFGSDGGSRSFTTISGAGTFSVNNAGGTFLVGGTNTGNTQHAATLNMSGLAFFNAALGTGTFRIGGLGSSTNAAASTVRLAATSSITATTLDVGGRAAHPTDVQTLKLGNTANTLNAATINVGGAPDANVSRASGEISFDTGTGGLTVRGLAGADTRADLNVANSNSNTGSTITGLFDVTGHTVDIRLGTVNIGQRNNFNSSSGATIGTVSFDTGTLDVTNISMGRRLNAGQSNASLVSATLNIGGGIANIGSISMAENTGSSTSGSASSTLNFTGGVITLGGDISQVSSTQATGTLNLNGATLDMGGHNIGGATAVTNLNFQSGTLKNVAQINNGAGLTKTTGGTLVIEGTNTYTGATLVSAGTLLVSGQLGNTTVTVDALGIIGGDGTLGSSLQMNSGAKFAFSSTQTLTVNGTVVFATGFGVDDLFGLDSSVAAGTYTLIDGTSTDFSVAGLENFGSANAYDLGGGKSAYFQNGSLQLVVIPEPSVTALLGAIGMLALLRRRR